MFDEAHYVPILKFRQGEYLAMERLQTSIKDWCTPLFELPAEQWDFEEKKPKKSLEEHVEKVGRRLKKSWGVRRCFFDTGHVGDARSMADGKHHLVHVFDLLRAAGCNAVPATTLHRHVSYQASVASIIEADGRGCCLRLRPSDFDDGVRTPIRKLLRALSVAEAEVDLIIDSENEIAHSPTAQAAAWRSFVSSLPNLTAWRSLTLAGGSFPASLTPSSKYKPTGEVERWEWKAYKAIARSLDRRPTYGDYSAAAVKTELIDPRIMDPNARVKYASSEAWVVAVGQKVKKHGRGQYRQLCKYVIAHTPKAFDGATYSWADKYIADCARGKVSTGGSSTWPCVASNRHATKVVRDIASFFGASSIP